jgi:5-formyltetrahydrofolate cyclo-ligase
VPFEDVAAAKQTMRRRIIDTRKSLTSDQLDTHAAGLAEQTLALPELGGARTVAAYYSVDREPGTRGLLAALLDSGRRLLLPVVTESLDLDWAEVTDLDDLATARMGLREPTGERLGLEAIGAADVVLCPGLAVDVRGVRLGRGAGCYDRALTHVDSDALRCILVYDHEVVESVPSDRNDLPVDVAVTPTRTLRLGSDTPASEILRRGRRD